MKKNNLSKFVLMILALPFLGAAIYMTNELINAIKFQQEYKEVEGHVIGHEKTFPKDQIYPRNIYEYSVNGTTYYAVDNDISINSDSIGTIATIKYKIENPEKIYMGPDPEYMFYIIFIIAFSGATILLIHGVINYEKNKLLQKEFDKKYKNNKIKKMLEAPPKRISKTVYYNPIYNRSKIYKIQKILIFFVLLSLISYFSILPYLNKEYLKVTAYIKDYYSEQIVEDNETIIKHTITYEYTVNEKTYEFIESTTLNIEDMKEIEIEYNKNNPEDVKEVDHQTNLNFIIGIILSCFIFIMIIRIIIKK